MAVSEDTESDDNESDLVSVLAFLLRSGQARLVRATTEGGSGIHIIHGMSSSDSDDDEDDDDDDFAFHNGKAPSPPVDPNPNTLSVDQSVFKQDTVLSSGQTLDNYLHNQNICSRLHMRESSLCRRPNFTQGDRAAACANFIPTRWKQRLNIFTSYFVADFPVMAKCFFQLVKRIRLYDTTQGQFKEFRNIVARDVGWSVIDTDYSPDQQYLIYSSWSDYVHLCNIYGDHETHTALCLNPEDSRFCAFSIKFSHDNKEILAGANDASLYVYDRGSNQRTLRVHGHDDDVDSVAFADSSSQIVFSGADDGLCKVWDRRQLDESCPCPVGVFAGHADGITHIDPRGDGRHLITNSKDQTIKLWDMRKFSGEEGISSTKRAVAGQRWDYRWQPVPRKSVRRSKLLGDSSLMTYRGHSVLHTLIRCYFSPMHTTGQRYIYSGCSTGSVVLYDVLTGKIVSRLTGHRSAVRDVSWHPYENEIVSTSWDGTLGLWRYKRKEDDDEEEEEPVAKENPPCRRSIRLLHRNLLSF
ncbi:DDB1- and CUL4-associated factor 11 [Desmophyllum pertusum]|uniref:DDB1- and CUL4-associated factor 11 n=1 Tax=Desmophyllum pertusum TaxID=174260 RepID=A0A9W9YE51_9CNID|nr:DDB1- and CUL4-associated factor 11 [Desmophyllum pertusum]